MADPMAPIRGDPFLAMQLVQVRLLRREVEGYPMVDQSVPLGKWYVIDLRRQALGVLVDPATGRVAEVRCVWVELAEGGEGDNGLIPVACFGLGAGLAREIPP